MAEILLKLHFRETLKTYNCIDHTVMEIFRNIVKEVVIQFNEFGWFVVFFAVFRRSFYFANRFSIVHCAEVFDIIAQLELFFEYVFRGYTTELLQ